MQLSQNASLFKSTIVAQPPRSAQPMPSSRPRTLQVRAADTGDTVCAGKLHRWLDQEGKRPATRFDARMAQLRARDADFVRRVDKLLGTGKHSYWELEHGYLGGPSLGDLGAVLYLFNHVTVYAAALEAYRRGLLTDDQLKASIFLLPQLSMFAGAVPKAGVRLAEAVQAGAELGSRAADRV